MPRCIICDASDLNPSLYVSSTPRFTKQEEFHMTENGQLCDECYQSIASAAKRAVTAEEIHAIDLNTLEEGGEVLLYDEDHPFELSEIDDIDIPIEDDEDLPSD